MFLFPLSQSGVLSSACALIIRDDSTHDAPPPSEAKKDEARDLEKQEREVPTLEG